ncbi:MAG: hypothetical protein WBG42_12405 [Cryomorphaceae bacterium]
MRKRSFTIFFAFMTFTYCTEPVQNEVKPKPMIYEGMSATELRDVLGEPIEIDSKSEIFNAQSMTKMSLEHWVYERRTVLLINDTVKNPNLN